MASQKISRTTSNRGGGDGERGGPIERQLKLTRHQMTIAALVVGRYKSPAGIGESERHALHCGLWLRGGRPTTGTASSSNVDGKSSLLPTDDSTTTTGAAETWQGYCWIDHPVEWKHLRGLLRSLREPVSLLHVHVLEPKKVGDKYVNSVLKRLEELLQIHHRQHLDPRDAHEDNENDEAAMLSVRVEYHESVSKAPLSHVLKRHGISPMHILPQLDSHVLQVSAVLALGLTQEMIPATGGSTTSGGAVVELALGRMPDVMHVDLSTARETLHVWPPATHGDAVNVGGTSATNSLYGLLASSNSAGGAGGAGRSNHQYLTTILGKRCWARWLHQPCYDINELTRRQGAVAWLVAHGVPRDSIHSSLAALNLDITQLAQQLSNHRLLDDDDDDSARNGDDSMQVDGAPSQPHQQQQPLGSTRKALQALYNLYLLANQKLPLILDSLLSAVGSDESDAASDVPDLLRSAAVSLEKMDAQLRNAAALAEAVIDLDQAPREFLVKSSYRDELQDLHLELDQTNQQIEDSVDEMNEIWSECGGSGGGGSAPPVKLETTNNDGYQFRLADANAAKVLETISGVRIHRILKNGVYFSTKTLIELSTKHADLIQQYEQYQRQVVVEAMPVAASFVDVLDPLALCLAELDVVVGLALLASHRNYCRPILTHSSLSGGPDGGRIVLEEARHPCVELHTDFIPNSARFERDKSSFMIVTGPNMGGKSTFLRSLGAIVTLAQVGSFVPCSSATIELVDAVLARVGAGDQQDRGISTFMAEMLDSAAILRRASSRSLILIDELGRGTSTYDGYGLAKGISEYIINRIRCYTVFTTHFHELTALQESHAQVVNYHVTAQKSSAGLVFLYQVRPGPCLESFGIQVAEMAQMPVVVIEDAKRKALELERFEYRKRVPGAIDSSDDAAATEVGDSLSILERFRKADIPGILQRYEGASDEEKRQAILAALGETTEAQVTQ